MAGNVRPLDRALGPELFEGERVLGGSKAGGKNAVLAEGFGGIAGALLASRDAPTAGLAEAIPQDRIFWVAVTDRRLLYLGVSAMTGAPRRVRGWTALEDVAGVRIATNRLTHRMVFAFSDGGAATIDVPRLGTSEQLVRALHSALPGRVRIEPARRQGHRA